jgi:hypothetical protein
MNDTHGLLFAIDDWYMPQTAISHYSPYISQRVCRRAAHHIPTHDLVHGRIQTFSQRVTVDLGKNIGLCENSDHEAFSANDQEIGLSFGENRYGVPYYGICQDDH